MDLRETIYGSRKRLEWVARHLEGRTLDVGCGTGRMLTIPLFLARHRIEGLDADRASIEHGREILTRLGADPAILRAGTLHGIRGTYRTVVMSEVLEHCADSELGELLDLVFAALEDDGVLLVTVPNGYGWFEMENAAWRRIVGPVCEGLRLHKLIFKIKYALLGREWENTFPSTLDSSPHVQRFTLTTLTARLRKHGFEVLEFTGSGLIGGPLTNLLFTGVGVVMRLNNLAGDWFPRMASGFFVAARKVGQHS
jgi:SAM-dependent methyltransferase